jgi:hypothetical protein
VKKKKRHYFRNSAFLFSSGDTNILHFISDGRKWGSLTRKSPISVAVCLFTFPSAFESKLSALLEMQKASQI